VHVLLPPSEAKSAGGRGRPLVAQRPHPLLGPARAEALAALDQLVSADRDAAAAALLLPPATVSDALDANASVSHSPTMPALRRYRGTVYAGLDADSFPPPQFRLAARCTWVFSGLFGVLRGDEPVPAYRVPAKSVLPALGVAGTFWRRTLDVVLPQLLGRGGPIVDLRSSDYAAMWRPRGELADRAITVRVLSPLPGGRYGVVSFPSKLGKGRLVAALVRRTAAGQPVAGVADVADAWLAAGGADADASDTNRLVLYTG
jgi:cytoplasmic iron level regulating protein YaaA (DUF328/UPF0246 family)